MISFTLNKNCSKVYPNAGHLRTYCLTGVLGKEKATQFSTSALQTLSCLYGCQVLELRESRLDHEETLAELQKATDEHKRNLDRQVSS